MTHPVIRRAIRRGSQTSGVGGSREPLGIFGSVVAIGTRAFTASEATTAWTRS